MTPPLQRWLGKAMRWIALAIAAWYALSALAILTLRWINPRTTAVQIQRRVETLIPIRPFTKGPASRGIHRAACRARPDLIDWE